MNIPAPQNTGGNPPNVEDGLYVARFDDITERVVESFITDKDKFGKPDDGKRYDFLFTLLDDERNPVLLMAVKEDVDDPTEELQLRQAKSIRAISSGEKSNSFAVMKGILTPAEMAMWVASTAESPVDLSHVSGREVNVQVSHSASGWPQIEATLGPAKPKGKK